MVVLSKCLIVWPCRDPTVAFASAITNVGFMLTRASWARSGPTDGLILGVPFFQPPVFYILFPLEFLLNMYFQLSVKRQISAFVGLHLGQVSVVAKFTAPLQAQQTASRCLEIGYTDCWMLPVQ
jgi:hypothetical protein